MAKPVGIPEVALDAEALFEVAVSGWQRQALRVDQLTGRERLSGAWSFEVEATAADIGDRLPGAVGQRAALVMRAGASPRVFSGMVAAARLVHRDPIHGLVRCRLRLVSRLWSLRFKRRSRVFHESRLDAIVSETLREAGIECEWRLGGNYPVREHTTQYEESDYAFIRRLTAEAAVAFRHAPPAADVAELFAGDRIVFGDATSLYAPIALGPAGAERAPALRYMAAEGTATPAVDEITRFELDNRLRTNAAAYWEYDAEHPEAMLTANARVGANGESFEHYEHHGEYSSRKWEYGRAEPERILRQTRRRAQTAKGASTAVALAAGHTVRLDEHPIEQANREYAVVRVDHVGRAAMADRRGTYENQFECVPSDVFFCPPRPERRRVLVALTATVVGAAGDEIRTDSMGRIKVQFHWDRESQRDDRSSCWIRAMQGWGGQNWGSQFIPRVGMEVVVAFDGGDPDKPIVLGCLYNGTHPPPFRTPEEKTKSGLRTRSTPNAEGFNELSFEDEAGKEQVYLRAERDLLEKIGRNHTTTVEREHTATVGGNQSLAVGGNQASRVGGSRLHETVGADVVKTLGDSEMHVGGERRQRVGRGERRTVGGDEIVKVEGKSLHTVLGNCNLRTDGNYSVEIGTREKPAAMDLYAWGHALVGTGMAFSLRADQKISFTCGQSSIELSKDAIKLSAPKLQLSGEKEVAVSGDGPHLRLDKKAEIAADKVHIYSSKASIELDEDAHVDGKLVKLACDGGDPAQLVDDDGKPKTQPLRLKLTDAKHRPYAGKEFVVKAGGARVEGTTGGDGSVDVPIPIEAQTAEVTVWLKKRPTGPTRRYVVELTKLDPPESVKGAQQRLRHLGYYFRTPTGELDAPTKHAIEAFQKGHSLAVTGKLDDATQSKLSDSHGH